MSLDANLFLLLQISIASHLNLVVSSTMISAVLLEQRSFTFLKVGLAWEPIFGGRYFFWKLIFKYVKPNLHATQKKTGILNRFLAAWLLPPPPQITIRISGERFVKGNCFACALQSLLNFNSFIKNLNTSKLYWRNCHIIKSQIG